MSLNAEVAALLDEYADLLDAQGDEHRPRAYRRAADNVRAYHEPIEELAADGPDAVDDIEGVGEAIAGKLIEYVETGEIEELEAERANMPVDMAALTSVEGVGPRTVGDLYRELGVTTLDELEAAAREGRIRELTATVRRARRTSWRTSRSPDRPRSGNCWATPARLRRRC